MDIAAVKALAARHDSEEAEEFLDALEDGDEDRARVAARDFMKTIQQTGRIDNYGYRLIVEKPEPVPTILEAEIAEMLAMPEPVDEGDDFPDDDEDVDRI